MDFNKVKITLANKSFDVTLNEGESLYLELKNNKGEIYLSNVPKKNDMPIYDKEDVKEVSKIKMTSKDMAYKTGKEYHSSIYDVLNEVIQPNEQQESENTSEYTENKQTTVGEILNEVQSNDPSEEETEQEHTDNDNEDDQTSLDIDEDEETLLDLDDDEPEEKENFKERYILELEE